MSCFKPNVANVDMLIAKLPEQAQEKLIAAIKGATESKTENHLTAIASALMHKEEDAVAKFKDSVNSKAGGALFISMLHLGQELGLFKILCQLTDTFTVEELAHSAGVNLRYCKEWCIVMAAEGILIYDANSNKFSFTSALLPFFTDETSLAICTNVLATIQFPERLAAVYKSGKGIKWSDRHPLTFNSCARFFQPLYQTGLISNLPHVVAEKLRGPGARLLEMGCGEGISCSVFGATFPSAAVVGLDVHEPSIQKASELIATKGLQNVKFKVGSATDASVFNQEQFDVVTFLDCFHDMSAASAAAKAVYALVKDDGYVLLMEPPGAEDDSIAAQIAEPSCGVFGAFSCHVCLPCAMVDGGDGLGTICPTSRHRDLFLAAGFTSLNTVPNDTGFRMMLVSKTGTNAV